MLINHAAKQVTAKIVYYGPGLSGKTTNLKYIYETTNPNTRGELVSMETTTERTIFFDLLPMEVGMIQGYQVSFQLYTVPGQVFYDTTRRLVLKGADGIVFVADSQELMAQANKESMENLKENLALLKMSMDEIPLILQFNKRDLKNVMSVDELLDLLDIGDWPYFEAKSNTGEGVIETLMAISTLTIVKIKDVIESNLNFPQNIPNVNAGQIKEFIEKESIEDESKEKREQDSPPQALIKFDTDPKWMLKKDDSDSIVSFDNERDSLGKRHDSLKKTESKKEVKIQKDKKLLKSKLDINAELNLLSENSRILRKKNKFLKKTISVGDSNKLSLLIKDAKGDVLDELKIPVKGLPIRLNIELDVEK